MARTRIAIDGCGTLTTETILPHLFQPDFQDRAEVLAVCDIVRERAQSVADTFGIPEVYGSLDEMLASSDAEAVLVITPHRLHAPHAIQIAQSGRHVYVQKPMAASVSEALELLAVVADLGVKMVAAPGQTLWPMYGQIREVIAQGEIGKVFYAQPPMMGWGSYDVGFPNHPGWFFGKDAGPLRDHGGYGFQSLVAVLGRAKRVMAMSGAAEPTRRWNGELFDVTGHDNSMVVLDFGGNTFGLLPEAWCDTSPGSRFLRIHGLNGAIETDPETFNHLDILPIGATVRRIGKPDLRLECPLDSVPFARGKHPSLGHLHVYGDILHLVDCIQNDTAPVANGELGLHLVDMIDAAFRAAETGMTQALRG